MNRSFRWNALLARTLIGLVAFPTSLLSNAGAVSADGGTVYLVEVSPTDGWVELYNDGLTATTIPAGTLQITKDDGSITLDTDITINSQTAKTVAVDGLQAEADHLIVSLSGSELASVSWGNGATDVVPAPSAGRTIVRNASHTALWFSNETATLNEYTPLKDTDLPPIATAVNVTPTGVITSANKTDVTVSFTVPTSAAFYDAVLIDQVGTATNVEQSSIHDEVSHIDASSLMDGRVIVRGYTEAGLLRSAWITGTANKVTAAVAPVITWPSAATWVNTLTANIKGTTSSTGTVTLYRDENADGSVIDETPIATASTEGSFNVPVAIATTGNNLLLATFTDVYGNISPVATVPAITYDATIPAAPMQLMATMSDQCVHLSWLASSSNDVTSYRIYTDNNQLAASVPANTLVYTTNTLSAGTYSYVVAAVDHAGNESALSNLVSTTIIAPINTPTNLITTAGNNQVLLHWDLVANATGYLVRYRPAGQADGSYTTVFISGGLNQEYTVTGLTNGLSYEFGVAAQDASGSTSQFANVTQSPIAPAAIVATTTETTTPQATYAVTHKVRVTQDAIGGQVSPIASSDVTRIEEDQTSTKQTDDVKESIVKENPTDTTNADNRNQSLVTFLIVVLAAAAGFGGYYGYQWWVATPEEAAASTAPKEQPKAPKKSERRGRW